MAAIIPNEGEARLLLEILDGNTNRENWTLKLFKTNVTPAETDTSASYTPADFTNVTTPSLIRLVTAGNWNAITQNAPTGSWSAEASVAESTYAQQTWTCGALVQNTIYGYFFLGAQSNKVILAEAFAVPRALGIGDQLNFTPRFGAA